MPDSASRFPGARPAGLARRSVRTPATYWRLDRSEADAWSWGGCPNPKHRFDPSSGAFRTRYAATRGHGAARERYAGTGRVIPAGDAGDHLVQLTTTRNLRVLDLRIAAVQDVLGVDDQINTSREPGIFVACQNLADVARGWWQELDGIVYRSRTTAQTATNLAFWSLDGFDVTSTPLGDATEFLSDLVLHHRFTVEFDF